MMDHTDNLETSTTPASREQPHETGTSSRPMTSEQEQLAEFWRALYQRTRWAIVAALLILANAVVFGLMVRQGMPWLTPDPKRMIEWGANYGPRTLAGEEWRLVASMFLHFGAVHLGMNMLALWSVGGLVERIFGNIGFLLLYLISGLAGSFASVLFHPEAISAGASGAIFGVAGGLLGGAWKLRRSLPPALLAAARSVAVNLLVLLVIYGVVNHFHPVIDNAAHVGGGLAGMLIGWLLAEPIPNPRPSRRGVRNLIVAGLGTAACYGAWMMLPHPPADVAALETQYKRVEKEVTRILESAEGRLRAGASTQEEYADILEQDVLPRWKKLHEDFQSAGSIPEVHREPMADLRKIIELREAGWELQIEALRKGDPQKARESEKRFDEAADIIRRLNQS